MRRIVLPSYLRDALFNPAKIDRHARVLASAVSGGLEASSITAGLSVKAAGVAPADAVPDAFAEPASVFELTYTGYVQPIDRTAPSYKGIMVGAVAGGTPCQLERLTIIGKTKGALDVPGNPATWRNPWDGTWELRHGGWPGAVVASGVAAVVKAANVGETDTSYTYRKGVWAPAPARESADDTYWVDVPYLGRESPTWVAVTARFRVLHQT